MASFLSKIAAKTYQQTDSEFLKDETSIYRHDGSTTLTAMLLGDRLYVANVGDSRAVILKASEGMVTITLLILSVDYIVIPSYIKHVTCYNLLGVTFPITIQSLEPFFYQKNI